MNIHPTLAATAGSYEAVLSRTLSAQKASQEEYMPTLRAVNCHARRRRITKTIVPSSLLIH